MSEDGTNKGWIRMYRKSVDDPMYFEEKFTRWQAWCDLLFWRHTSLMTSASEAIRLN